MRDLKNKLTSSKNTKNIQKRKGKSFGYQVLGFGAGGSSASFICATGGTITESGDFKIHTFTGPGTFCVASAGACAQVDYLVIAGGGAGGNWAAGGGGAGGFRESHNSCISGCYTASPLATPTSLPVTATGYPITIGGGGAGGPYQTGPSRTPGDPSTFSSITSAGGGRGAGAFQPACVPVMSGGSGGGNTGTGPSVGIGNTPPVSPPQGNNGNNTSHPGSNSQHSGGGGGGAQAAGTQGNGSQSGPGGAGSTTSISGSAVTRAGGGGAGGNAITAGAGGPGGGGAGSGNSAATPGTVNTGGGGGGGGGTNQNPPPSPAPAGNGGSGVVIIRYQFQ